MRVGIVGQFGHANVGDEGILQAIMDSLGAEHEFVVATNLPFNMTDEYTRRVPNASDIRTLEDSRTDLDACIYGGGKVDWGFGWDYFIRVFAEDIPTMAYGIAVRTDQTLKHSRLYSLYGEFFRRFDVVTVRDIASEELLKPLHFSLNPQLTGCPAINLKEEKTLCPQGAVAVCPRYGDYNEKGEVDNNPQVDWIVKRLADVPRNEIMLIPFHPQDLEGHHRDMELCITINKRLGGGCYTFPCDGYNARKVKYAISRSKLVISGGRYHAIVWAMAHGIPCEITPTVGEPARSKLEGIKRMLEIYGRPALLEMEKENKRCFEGIF